MVALHNGNADSVVILMQNIGAVSRRMHQPRVGGLHIRRGGNIFRDRVEAQAGLADAFLQAHFARKLVRKVSMFGEQPGMGQRSLGQPVTPLQLAQTRFLALMVDQVKELLLTLRRSSVSECGSEKNKTSNRD